MINKVCLITGATNGLGLDVAYSLADEYEIIFAVRNIILGEERKQEILAQHKDAKISVYHLDLFSQKSVWECANEIKKDYQKIDILINNAGVALTPFTLSEEGYEMQFAVNHLGHFLFTNLLLDVITERIIIVSSIAADKAKLDFSSLSDESNYHKFKNYCQSKYANLLFGIHLNDLLKMQKSNVKVIVCHPGVSKSNLMSRGQSKKQNWLIDFGFKLIAQSTHAGAANILYAIKNEDLQGGEVIGPQSRDRKRGKPGLDKILMAKYDQRDAEKLWAFSEEATKVKY